MSYTIRVLDPAEVEAVGNVLGLAPLEQGDGFDLVAWFGTDPSSREKRLDA